MNGYYGTVIDNDDPLKIGRVKVRVNGFYDNVSDDLIPYAIPKNVAFNRLDPPPNGSIVQIEFLEGEIMTPIWFTHNGKSASDMGINSSDYVKSAVLLYKDLAEYASRGVVKIVFTETDGLVQEYLQEGESAKMELRKDNTVILNNTKYGKVIHISNESISLGTETKSKEPATLGQTNHDALDKTNDTIKKFSKIIETFASTCFQICMKVSILRPFAIPLKTLEIQLKTQISGKAYNENKAFYPKTKSRIVTLD